MTVTTPLGRVLRDDDGVRLEFVRTYEDPVADVWSALTEPERVARWLGPWTGDPATGSVELTMAAEDGAPAETVHIVRCEPPTLLVVDLPSPDGTWRVEVALTEAEGVTTLTFVQRLEEPYDAGAIGPGWHFYLDRFDATLAGAVVPDAFEDYHPALEGAYRLPG